MKRNWVACSKIASDKNLPHNHPFLDFLQVFQFLFYFIYFFLLEDLLLFVPLGPRELTGAVDLISYFKLLPHYEYFCKRPLPVSIADTHYLHNVVGETEIRKGDGMQLDQLVQNTSSFRETNARIQAFDLDILKEAFQLRETAPVDLPPVRNFL